MNSESYLLVNSSTNIVENVISWDGSNSWAPPTGYIAVPKATTQAKVWLVNTETRVFDLVTVSGCGDIGFTWDGTSFMTNEQQPDPLITIVETA